MARKQALAVILALACALAAATPVLAQTAPARPESPQRPPDPQVTAQQDQSKILGEQAASSYNGGRYQQALSLFDEARRLDPDATEILSMRGETYVQLGRCVEAIADFDAYEDVIFIGEFLFYANVFSNRGYCHMQLNNHEAAADDLMQQVIYKPDDAWAWVTLGRANSFLKRHDEAETAYEKAIELKPDDAYNHFSLALDYLISGRTREALPYLRTTLRLEPDNKDAREMLASAEQELAAQAAAAIPPPAVATAAPTARPATPVAAGPRTYAPIDARSPLGRGIALYRETEPQQSLPYLIEATRLDPQDARGFAWLGAAYYMLGMQRESDAARDRALALDPGILATVR